VAEAEVAADSQDGIETKRLVAKIFIAGSIDDVWNEITKTDELQGAMFNMRLHTDGLKMGGHIRMRTDDGKYTGVVGEILAWDPPHRYGHTFKFTNYDDPPCYVFYDLKEVEGGVEFTLTAEGVPVGTKTAKQMEGGARFIVKNLKAIVETGRAPLGTRILYRFFKLMGPFSPASTRSENWPLPQA
jgi:uncharacterized protein YndB with AHSA1/START domain